MKTWANLGTLSTSFHLTKRKDVLKLQEVLTKLRIEAKNSGQKYITRHPPLKQLIFNQSFVSCLQILVTYSTVKMHEFIC